MSTVTQTGSGSSTGAIGQLYQNDRSVLKKDDFLTLLVTQLQHQDPMEPMKDQEFAAQLAQFGSLEAVQNLSSQFTRFVDQQQWSSQLGQATGLIGKTVDLAVDDAKITGTVSAVRVVDGSVSVVVNGETYDIGKLQEVRA